MSDIIETIIAQASSLHERVDPHSFVVADFTEEPVIEERWHRWQQLIADGDEEKFQRRLKWNGWTLPSIRLALGNMRLKKDTTLPTWANILKEILTSSEKFSSPYSIPRDAVPFEEILFPIIAIARKKLFSMLNEQILAQYFSLAAYEQLESSLLHRLSTIAEQTLEFEFNKERPANGAFFRHKLMEEEETAANQLNNHYYCSFVEKLLAPKYRLTFFTTYPVLGRLLATAVELWVDMAIEFFQRLIKDYLLIQKEFFAQGKVIELETSLSDPHRGGRSVIIFNFENNVKLVYKPKDLTISQAYNEFLATCNTLNPPLIFKTTKIVTGDQYGWEEFIEHTPCVSLAEVKRFYERAGMLTCVLYLLAATDCHGENLVAHGEHLVLIDNETLLTPIASHVDDDFLWNSVLRIGLLPRWEKYPESDTVFDNSALGCPESEQAAPYVKKWKYINTDFMFSTLEPTDKVWVMPNLVKLNGKTMAARDYVTELVSGFQQMYYFLLRHRNIFCCKEFFQSNFRFVCRNTKVYYFILQKSYAPQNLTAGINRSIEIDMLSRTFLIEEERPSTWPILLSEFVEMERMDIPYFATPASAKDLATIFSITVKDFFKNSSAHFLKLQLQQLNETDLKQQIALIKGAYHTQGLRPPHQAMISSPQQENLKNIPLPTRQELFQYIETIALNIKDQALQDQHAHVRWIAPGYINQVDRLQLQVLGNNLYDGNIGIALFLAAFYHLSSAPSFKELATNALQPICQIWRTKNVTVQRRFAHNLGIGGYAGLGSLIYGLTLISYLLNDTEWLNDALCAADLLTLEAIQADKEFDVLAGAAGALLGLLALYTKTKAPNLLKKAIRCGQHIIQNQQEHNGFFTWKGTLSAWPLTGFSHGAAGIIYALSSLYATTENVIYLKAAEKGLAFERSVFSSTKNNWPDFRFLSEHQKHTNQFMVNWCHGAPGITLARLGLLPILDNAAIQEDIQSGLKTTLQHLTGELDHVCCGMFGRLETLLVATEKLKSTVWLEIIGKKVKQYLIRNNSANNSSLATAAAFNPGFFQGTAGIGYQLLRIIEPKIFPSVLMLEKERSHTR